MKKNNLIKLVLLKLPQPFLLGCQNSSFPTIFYLCMQDALCDLLDGEGKESLEMAVCKESSEKSPRAFWAFRRLGYLQVLAKTNLFIIFHICVCLLFCVICCRWLSTFIGAIHIC